MKFRNYCIVVLGNTEGVNEEIQKMSETTPNVLNAKGVLIATFSSLSEPSELTDWFKSQNRNFLIFDLDKDNSGFHITKPQIHEGLFGFLKTIDTEEMSDKFFKIMELSSKTENIDAQIKKPVKVRNIIDIEKVKDMGPKEKQTLLDNIIDGGLENLSEHDKKWLYLLAK